MTIVVTCPYCSKDFTTYYPELHARPGSRNEFKCTCQNCNSRIGLVMKVMRLGKSARVKKAEKQRKEQQELRAEAAYNNTDASNIKPWTSLTEAEKHLHIQRIVWSDAGYKTNW